MSTETPCCEDYQGVSRRGFLRGGLLLGGAVAATATHGAATMQTTFAAEPADRVLVVLSMRGAADGLSLVVPHADPAYYKARPSISVAADRLLAKDAMFGLHPSLAPLLPYWNSGKMAAVHATGLPVANRSHFAAMEEVEDADPGSVTRVGWLNRLVGNIGSGSPVEAVQFGGGVPSAAMCGPAPILVTQGVGSVSLAGADATTEQARRTALATAWSGSTGDLGAGFRSALDVVDDFEPVHATSEDPANGAVYPIYSDLSDALRSAARTIRADVGAEIITVDHGSWDHHTWVGNPDSGNLKNKADEFAKALSAFFTDLGALSEKVTVITISEFGRRVAENANQGLDHGHGNVMFAIGAGVKGGYYGTWPGLVNAPDADLAVTTDYRHVLSEVITRRFNASPATVFPGINPQTIGFMRAA